MVNSTSIKRKYETLFFPKVNRTIKAKFKEVISDVKSSGIQPAITNLSGDIHNPELTNAVKQLYATVGIRFANDSYRGLKIAERGLKRPAKSIELSNNTTCPHCGSSTPDIESGMGYIKCVNCGNTFSSNKSSSNGLETKAGASFGFNEQWTNWIINYLNDHLIRKITFDVNATTKEHLLNVLQQAIREGLGIDETVKLLQDDTFSETQSARIVRTEVNMASNAGTLAAGETYEYQMQKEWIAVEDFRTRGVNPKDHASHIGLNGTIIDFEDVFVDPRNNDRLKSPGDPRAKAESTINCRCQLGLKPKRDKNGRLIPKRKTTVVIYPNQNRRMPVVTI